MREAEEPATPPPAPAEVPATPTPPPVPEEPPKAEFDITKCARPPLSTAHARALSAAASGARATHWPRRTRRSRMDESSYPEAARCLTSAVAARLRSYSITITLAVVFVLAKAAGYFGLIDSN